MYTQQELFTVAKMYFEEGKKQVEISEFLNYSRSTVSRMIEKSIKTGIVEIKINYPEIEFIDLEEKIKNHFNLKHICVIPIVNNSEKVLLNQLSKNLIEFLVSICRDGSKIGLSWGTTLSAVNTFLNKENIKTNFKNVTVFQINGGSSRLNYQMGAASLLDSVSKLLNGSANYLSIPSIVDSAEIACTISTDSNIKSVLNMGLEMDIAIFSIGRISFDSVLFKSGYFTTKDYKKMISSLAVGDICSRFFDIKGNIVDESLDQRTISVSLSNLRKIPYTIGIASGVEKTKAVIGALNGSYVNSLIIDESIAREICNTLNL